MSARDALLSKDPYSLSTAEKEPLFFEAMKESFTHHYENSEAYRNFCKKKSIDPSSFSLETIPALPISLFKTQKLLSVNESDIIKTIRSSATTGKTPSTVYIDKITSDRQIQALRSIMADFIGAERKPFLVIDSQNTAKSTQGLVSSRGSAIRGMVMFAKKMHFLLNDDLTLRDDSSEVLLSLGESNIVFGFTYLIYQFIKANENNTALQEELAKHQFSHLIHIGGWKKLRDLNVSKEDFNTLVSSFFSLPKEGVIDFYGMTEQLGTVYPDCPVGNKHVPLYSDIRILDVRTLKPVTDGSVGFIQLLSPIPHSYPGISLLTDDLGKIVHVDDCPCGRKGKAFQFMGRAKEAEIKGCGDTLQ